MSEFKYAMEREIYEQPEIIEKLLDNYVSSDNKILIDTPEKAQKSALSQAVRLTTVA